MRAERFGSYSMLTTLAGMPSLARSKSIRRYWRLCPPPRWRLVTRPLTLRPPVRSLVSISDFSGFDVVSSSKVEMVIDRREGLVGFWTLKGMSGPFEEFDALTLLHGGDGLLAVGLLRHGKPEALGL